MEDLFRKSELPMVLSFVFFASSVGLCFLKRNFFNDLSNIDNAHIIVNTTDKANLDHATVDNSKIATRACFGAGCYWGTEKYFFHEFWKKPRKGKVLGGAVGFMGPEDAPINPSYKEVCSGATGHVEVYDLEFDGGPDFYEELVRYFFQFHDPTTLNRQGNDKGTQYASVIYCYDKIQFDIATKVKKELQFLLDNKKVFKCLKNSVETDIRMSTIFYPAHEEHQDYLMKKPNGYCNHRIRFEWPDNSAE